MTSTRNLNNRRLFSLSFRLCPILLGLTTSGGWSADQVEQFRQPDGTTIKIREVTMHGTSFVLDTNGYAVMLVNEERYEYALRGEEGGLIPSGVELGNLADVESSGLQKGLRPSTAFLERQRAKVDVKPSPRVPPRPFFTVQTPLGPKQLWNRRVDSYGWYEDKNGYSVVRVPSRYEYAVLGKDRNLIPLGFLAGSIDPAELGLRSISTSTR